MTRIEKAGKGWLGFHRLAIMGLHEEGMQPFRLGGDLCVCNGELYLFRTLKRSWRTRDSFSEAAPTASSYCPCGASTERGCLKSWTRSSPC